MKFRKWYLLLSIGLILIQCKKREIPVVKEDNYWKPVNKLNFGEKNARYCYSNGEELLIRSLSKYSLLDSQHQLIQTYLDNNLTSYLFRPFPMSGNYFISIVSTNGYIEYRSISSQNPDQGNFLLHQDSHILSLDQSFPNYAAPAFLSSNFGQFAFKVIDKSNNNLSTIALVNVRNNQVVNKIHLASRYNETILNLYHNQSFYLSQLNKGLLKIDSMGNATKISDLTFTNILEANGILYGIGYGGTFNLYVSSDNGWNWVPSTFALPTLLMVTLDKKPFYLINDKIVQIKIEGNTIKSIEYNSNGLEGNEITWVCKHRGKYYCTTKSGVFYIEEKYFNAK